MISFTISQPEDIFTFLRFSIVGRLLWPRSMANGHFVAFHMDVELTLYMVTIGHDDFDRSCSL